MTDQGLLRENALLRQRIKELEQSESILRRAEEALRASEIKFRMLHRSMIDAFAAVDMQGRILDYNPTFLRMLGYAPDEIRRMTYEDITPGKWHAMEKAIIESEVLTRGYSGIYEKEYRRKDGTVFPVELRTTLLRDADGDLSLMWAIVRDISERKRTEKALRESEERFKSFVSTSQDWIWAIDSEGRHTFSNDALDQILGYRPGEIVGQDLLHLLHEDDFAHVRETLDRCRAENTGWKSLVLRWRHRDGSYRYLESNAVPILDAAGSLQGFQGSDRDITEWKRAEATLLESEEKFSRVFRMSPDIMTITRLRDSVYVDVSDEFTRQTGYAREEAIGRTPFDLAVWIDPSDRERVLESLRADEEMQAREYRFRRRNGTIFTCEMTARIITIGGERCLLGMYRNVTEKIEAERARRESEEKFRSVVEKSLVGIAIIDDASRYAYVNEEFCRLSGYSEQELLGRHSDFSLTEESRKMMTERLERRLQGEDVPSHYEFSFLRKDGAKRTGEVRSALYLDSSGRMKAIIQVIDITDRKNTEESLLLMQFAMDNAPDSILLVDHDGGIEYANNAACTSMGYSREELLGMTVFDIDPDFPIEGWEQHKMDVRRLGRMTFTSNHRKKDGQLFPVEVNTNYFDYKGNFLSIAFDRDITGRRQAEEERRLLEERLNRAEKMEALGKLAGGVAHDLNNTLGVVIGYTELLLNSLDADSPVRSRLTSIMQAGGRAAAIVQDLLTLARRGVTGKEVLNLNRIVGDFQKSPEIENLASHHPGVRFRIDLEPDLLNISGSSVHLAKTLFNLVSNAVEAMPGGGLLTVMTANHCLDRPLFGYEQVREGDYVVLAVSDAGEGISAADLPHIFEPFYTKKVMGRSGTGLGLSVVWGTVKDHDGFIHVQSGEGKGSTFTIYFPVTREELPVAAVSTPVSEYMGREESILVVDDVREQRELAAELLRSLRYHVDIVSSGEEAMDYLRENRADLVLLDMIMDPGMDGLDTYRHILEINPKQKAIIVSGFSETDRVNEAQALGAGEYVRKPYVVEKLGLAVRRELDRTA
ncbi:MAG: PAS domain S-box protein [Syntrophaceae bacterium]|nr:PAS domain S-box protein [Syntrophaceae bacterium]